MTDQVRVIDIGDSNKAIQVLEAADKNLRSIQFISKDMALEFNKCRNECSTHGSGRKPYRGSKRRYG